MLKRGYHGTYHKMSKKHLSRHVVEFSGRHNLRPFDTKDQMEQVAYDLNGKRLRYKGFGGLKIIPSHFNQIPIIQRGLAGEKMYDRIICKNELQKRPNNTKHEDCPDGYPYISLYACKAFAQNLGFFFGLLESIPQVVSKIIETLHYPYGYTFRRIGNIEIFILFINLIHFFSSASSNQSP